MKRHRLFGLLAWIAVCGAAFAQSGGLQVFPQAVEMNFPQGYEVYSDAGKLLKTVPGPTSATVQAKTTGKTFAVGEVYLSDWSYDHLQQGKLPNWIVPKSNVAADAVSQGSAPSGDPAGLVIYPAIKEVSFPEGYNVFNDDGQLIKTVPGPTSIALKGETSGKTFANGTAYLSDWSYDQLQQGKEPNWVVSKEQIAVGKADAAPINSPRFPVVTLLGEDSENPRQSTSKDRPADVIPIAQTQPSGRVVGATASSGRKVLAIATDGNVFLYELPSGRLLKTLLAASFTDDSLKGIYFGTDEDSLFLVEASPAASESGQTNELTVRLLNWKSGVSKPLFKVSRGEIVGFCQLREVFALFDRSPNWPQGASSIHELSARGEVIRSHSVGYATAAVFAEDGSLLAVMNDDGNGMSISGVSIIKNGSCEELEGAEAAVEVGKAMKLPPSVLASAAFAENQEILSDGNGSLPLGPSLLLCQEPGVFAGKNPALTFALAEDGFLSAKKLASSQLLAVEGVATTEDGNKLLAWPINGQGEGVTNDRESLSANRKSDGLPLLFDFQTLQGRWMQTEGDIVVNGALSPDGNSVCLVRTSFGELKKQPQGYRLFVERSQDSKALTVFSEAGGQSLSYTFENNMIDPDRALIETAVQFNGGLYSFEPCLWTVDVNGDQIKVQKNHDLEAAQNEGFWSFGRPPSSLRFETLAHDSGTRIEWTNAGADQVAGSNLKITPANARASYTLKLGERIAAAYAIKNDAILVSGDRGVSTISPRFSSAQSEWTMPQALNRWSVQAMQRAAFASEGGKLYRVADDGSIFLLDCNTSGRVQEVARIFTQIHSGPVFVTPDNFFASPFSGNGVVHFSDGTKTYPFEQFDLRLNRPDIVLERLGAPEQAVRIAKQLREKRLKRMGVTEEMLKPDFHVPELDIVGDVPATTYADHINLAIKASDSKYPLERLKVYVNNVPVNGRDGELLREGGESNGGLLGRITGAFSKVSTGPQSLERTIPIKLAVGRNKIQVSVLNNAGAESLYANAEINCTAKRPKPTLYAVAMGVSEYSNADWNLKYAAKDAKDVLAKLKAKAGGQYGEVKELLLADRDVTKESLGKIREFLKGATIDDTVVMFAAGHGLLDSKYDYYFGTTDIDFNNPADKGIAFEEFDDILADLPCLKKSLLVDTCHAGELDQDEKALLASADSGGSAALPTGNGIAMRSIGTRGMNVKAIEGARGASEWYDRLQGLFVDLRRGSGSTILTSAAGAEYALESSEQQNGLFTYAVLEALDGKPDADTNKDGSVQMSELGEYVKKRVSELTNNKQTPNTRRVNLEGDFTVAKTR